MDTPTLAEMREWAAKELARLLREHHRLSWELADNERNQTQVRAILRMIDDPSPPKEPVL